MVQIDGDTGSIIGGCVVFMKSTQLVPSRAWNTEILKIEGPRFSTVWELGSRIETSKRNDEYANFTITKKGYVSAELYAQLKPLYHAVSGIPEASAA
jgi:hypothetical protein